MSIKLECRQWPLVGQEQPPDIVLAKSTSEVLKFHAEVSNALMQIGSDLTGAGLTLKHEGQKSHIFAQVLHSGRLLKGLLELSGGYLDRHYMNTVCKSSFSSILIALLDALISLQLKCLLKSR